MASCAPSIGYDGCAFYDKLDAKVRDLKSNLGKRDIALVVAVAKNGVIGDDNKLLWRLKTDLRRFRALTIGKPVIMGRKTFASIGRPLPDRRSIVLTRDRAFSHPGVESVHSIDEALTRANEIAVEMGVREIMIVGGGDIYAQTLDLASHIYLTEVDMEPKGDTRFPAIDLSRFREVKRVAHPACLDDEAAFQFIDYVRR